MRPVLRARGLVLRYGPRTAVCGVDLDLVRGEVLGLLGPNGAGKTTLLRRMAGLLSGQAGTVDLDGSDPARDPAIRARIGYLPEDPPLYGDDTALQYVSHLAGVAGVRSRECRARAATALETVGAGDLARRLCGRLSKGQRQRVALAAATVHEPDVLLLDEPSEGLDPRQMRALRLLLRNLASRAAIVFSTHLLAEAQTICDRVVVLDHGRVVLRKRMGERSSRRLRLEVSSADPGAVHSTLRGIPGVLRIDKDVVEVASAGVAEEIAATVCSRGWRLRELTQVGDDLESAFLEAVAGRPR